MLNLPRFVFINGPSGSGKSTLAKAIIDSVPACWPDAFAEPVREMIRSVFFPEDGPVYFEHDLKDGAVKKKILSEVAAIGHSSMYGYGTVRETMIDFAEKFMKPRFGEDVFGRLLWKRCAEQDLWYSHFIIDDNGFAPEASYVISQSSPADCLLIRLHRTGCSFAGDSRSHITLDRVRTIDLHNDGAASEMMAALELELGNI